MSSHVGGGGWGSSSTVKPRIFCSSVIMHLITLAIKQRKNYPLPATTTRLYPSSLCHCWLQHSLSQLPFPSCRAGEQNIICYLLRLLNYERDMKGIYCSQQMGCWRTSYRLIHMQNQFLTMTKMPLYYIQREKTPYHDQGDSMLHLQRINSLP